MDELFMCIFCDRETPNGSPCPVCDHPRCALCGICVDQAWHDIEARRAG